MVAKRKPRKNGEGINAKWCSHAKNNDTAASTAIAADGVGRTTVAVNSQINGYYDYCNYTEN